jgi:hypothetical protein
LKKRICQKQRAGNSELDRDHRLEVLNRHIHDLPTATAGASKSNRAGDRRDRPGLRDGP